MSRTLLVSLISAQTVPNLQLIKRFWNEENYHLFIVTNKVINNEAQWLISASGIQSPIMIEVDSEDFDDVQNKLKKVCWNKYERIVVNITGGTKVMGISVVEFFKGKDNVEIYYITPKGNLISYYPEFMTDQLQEKITLSDYLKAYGFSWSKHSLSDIPFEQTKTVFKNFIKINLNDHIEALQYLNRCHNSNTKSKKKVSAEAYENVREFVEAVGYKPMLSGCLSKDEVDFLIGNWFEEYVGLTIKEQLQLGDDDLFIGTEISKEISEDNFTNDIVKLLGRKDNKKPKNEMDVMFMYNNRFYSIECKTSIVAHKTITDVNGQVQEKPYNILGETIYKSDSLSKKFGLFANTFIVTLTDFKEYIGSNVNMANSMMNLINRANLSNITLVDKSRLVNEDILSILGI